MNNLGRGNWFLMFGLFVVGMAVLVGAVAWDATANDVIYGTVEETLYTHNLSANVTGVGDGIAFSISPGDGIAPYIYWNDAVVDLSDISDWISIENSSTGNLTINALYDNQTGSFRLPLRVAEGEDAQTTTFNFTVNATNDAPNFTSSGIANNYSFSADSSVQNFTLTGSDEEGHFPLVFNVTFNGTCVHGTDTGYSADENCSLFDFGLTLTNSSNETSIISFAPNSSYIGTYWANVSVMDAAVDYNCPHNWCDATYNTTNLTTYYSEMVKFTVYPSLTVNVSNCTGAVLMEDEEFNCTIVITTPGETDILDITSDASFRNVENSPYNSSWFYGDNTTSASNFNYNVSVSVTPGKVDVGNYTINFSVDNGDVDAVSESIFVYVNYTESNVTMNAIGDETLYEDFEFDVTAFDNDLFILDGSVKSESLTFASNTSWVTQNGANANSANYSVATFGVDWDSVMASDGEGNYSIMINVTDTASPANNTHNRTFTIEILNETAPEWNVSLDDPVSLVLTEGTAFSYNVSINVTDEEGDPIIFYYENVSAEFCSLNSTNFNSSSGIISFTPTDCDVGEHNVTIIASDTKLNSSHSFNFTVNNLADDPGIQSFKAYNGTVETLVEDFNLVVQENSEVVFNLTVDDDDFLIPSGQRSSFYNESLTIDVTFTNSSDVVVSDLFNFSFVGVNGIDSSWMDYNASFTPTGGQVDNYTVFVNITDVSGTSINRTFYLNISEVSDFPDIVAIANQSVTIHDVLNFSVNASDEEDDRNEVNISYSIANLTVGAPNLTIGNETGIVAFDMDSNSSYAGTWNYTVTVTDLDSNTNSSTFWLFVYGNATLVSPSSDSVFNLTENVAGILNFTINHSVGDNLTYEFWIDSISCGFQDSSNCSYGNFSLRETVNSFGNGSAYNWSFTSNYTDESYGNYKNLTVSVYPNTTALNSTQRSSVATNFSFKLNVSHTNAPPTIKVGFGPHPGTYGSSTPITVTLTDSIQDYDYLDSYYLQNVTFNVTSDASSTGITAEGTSLIDALPWDGFISDWSLQLYATSVVSELITISANDSFASVTSDSFNVTFTEPSVTVVTTPSSGGGTTTKLKHFSLKLIAPQDVIISEMGFIDIPFAVQNNGQTDLRGISLGSFVRFNDAFSDDVRISLEDNFIEELKIGQSENFTMRITANTQRAGRYKATIIANVTSPKFSDFADFFIDIRKANESEAEQILIFTEKFIAENPECLELTELLNEAEVAFSLGEYSNSLRMAREVVDACEDAIGANEQIRYKVEGFVQDNFYYISFATLVIFFIGFVFYIYKRVRFNKSGMDEYV